MSWLAIVGWIVVGALAMFAVVYVALWLFLRKFPYT